MNENPKGILKGYYIASEELVAGICFEFSIILFVERFGSRISLLKSNAALRKVHFEREYVSWEAGLCPASVPAARPADGRTS